MKTPRELLMERHRSMEPRLDAVRAAALSAVLRNQAPELPPRDTRPLVVQWILSLRWHLAGISSAWIVIAVANHDVTTTPQFASEQAPPPVARRLETLRENRRQLAELLNGSMGFTDPAQPAIGPQRRSQRVQSTWMA